MRKSAQRMRALIQKEIRQLLRDRRTMIYMISLPLIELFLFAYAVSLTVYHLPLGVVDQSRDQQSRALLQDLQNSQFFDITLQLDSHQALTDAIDHGDVKAGILIPPNFSDRLNRNDAQVLFLVDGSDAFSVQSGYSAITSIAQNTSFQLISEQVNDRDGDPLSLPIQSATRILYNPDFIDLWFILPGISAMIIQTLAVAQAAMAVVRERESGTIEQILVTPTRPLEMIVAKMLPLGAFILTINWVVLALGVYWFHVPFQGNPWIFFWLTLIFVLSTLGLGLFVSTISKTQRQAQQISSVIMIFGMLLSGIVYPRASMPVVAQAIGNLLPLTYFLRISRGIITKGVDFVVVQNDVFMLAAYTLVVLLIASFSFRKRLD